LANAKLPNEYLIREIMAGPKRIAIRPPELPGQLAKTKTATETRLPGLLLDQYQ